MQIKLCYYFRCFLSAGAPAVSPTCSRIVEALCVKLCKRHPVAKHDDSRYLSRWRLIISDYEAIRTRVLNCMELVDETTLTLPHINETTLIRWFKNTTRRNEVSTLLQGLSLPSTVSIAIDSLPPAKERTVIRRLPAAPHLFIEEPDRVGQASVRSAINASLHIVPRPVQLADQPAPEANPDHVRETEVVNVSRTTLWRKRKREAEAGRAQILPATAAAAASSSLSIPSTSTSSVVQPPNDSAVVSASAKLIRKTYSCRVCNLAMNSLGHTQFRGQRYCPSAVGAPSVDVWLQQKRLEAQAKSGK